MIYYLVEDKFAYFPVNKLILQMHKQLNRKDIENIISTEKCLLEEYDSELIRKPDDKFTFETLYPYNLGIIPTNECNLRCCYCYSETGEKPRKRLTEKQVENYINLLIRNAIIHSKVKKEPVEAKLVITGGGEPTFQWELFQFIVEFFSSQCALHNLKKKIVLVTNGIMNAAHVEYVINNIDQINLSADGFPEIQDVQRPTVSGEGSFKYLERFIRICERNKKIISVRATVLADNFLKMTEICKFFFANYSNISTIHFEPLFYVGRGKRLDDNHYQNLMQFLNLYIDAYCYVHKHFPGRNLYNSSFHYQLKEYFCSASIGLNPWLHMDGNILPCTDYINEPEFSIGKVTEQGISINRSNKKLIRNLNQCKQCFAFYHCGGGCPHNIEKDENGKNLSPISEAYCKMITEYWKRAIKSVGEGKAFCDIESDMVLENDLFKAYRVINK